MTWFLNKEIGLDLGSRTLKALKLKKKGSKIVLDRFFFYDLARGNEAYPTVIGLGASLQALVEVHGFSGMRVNSSLDESNMLVFDLTLPKMSEADLALAIESEIEQQIDFSVRDASVGHIVVSSDNETVTLKAFCIRCDGIQKTVELLKGATLLPISMEVATLANIATLEFNGYLKADVYNIAIDLGEAKTSVSLLKASKLIASTHLTIAMGTINSRLRELTPISYLDADEIKNASVDTEKKSAAKSESQSRVVETVYSELLNEIGRAIEFFQIKTNEQVIENIYVIGGGSQYSDLLSAIQQGSGIQTCAANPFRNIEIFSKKGAQAESVGHLAPYMATAVGLALRKLNAS
jgi:type IV pilus assembly protein PilM